MLGTLLKIFLTTNDECTSRDFRLVMSLPAMSLRDWFCLSGKDETEEGGWVHAHGAKKNDRFWAQLLERPWLTLGGPFLPFYAQVCLEHNPITL